MLEHRLKLFELILIMGKTLNFKFEVDLFLSKKNEVIIILKKNGRDI